METAVSVVIAVLAAWVVSLLRRRGVAQCSKRMLWLAAAICLGVPSLMYAGLKSGLLPGGVVSFSLTVLTIVYFAVLQAFRIHKEIASIDG